MATKVIAKSDTHAGLREKLNAALKAKHGPVSSYSYDDPYVQDVTDDKVVHTLSGHDKRGKLYASPYTKNDAGEVKLGDPKEVEQAYKPLSEAERTMVTEATQFTEAAKAYDAKTGLLTITVISEGFNKSGGRFYSKKALQETGSVFSGAKMFANHQTKQEEAARPEGRVQDWVANIVPDSLWTEKGSDGKTKLRAKAKVHDKNFKEKLAGLQEAGLLKEMGVSIRAGGEQVPAEVQGKKTMYVESFVVCKSVDFVTFPGAGGSVDMLESEGQHFLTADELASEFEESDSDDIAIVSLARLKESRPDLVAQLKTEVREALDMEKTKEQLEQELREANTKITELTTQVTTLTEATGKAAVQTELDKQLKESALPDASQKKLREQFKEATKVDGIKEAITSEADYLKGLGVELKSTKGVRGMGTSQEADISEADATKAHEGLVKTLVESGMTKEQAELSIKDRW